MAVFLIALLALTDARLLQERKYYDLVLESQDAAHALNDPIALREYACNITEYYTTQVGFRTFFVKNLQKGQRLESLRHRTETITPSTHGQLVVENLEALLIEALRKFPDDLDVRFAVANYLFRGRCCQTAPKLKLPPEQILETFRQAEAKGLCTAGSLLALTLEALAQERFDEADRLIQKGLALRDDEPPLVQAYMNELLRKKDYDGGLQQARKLFEITFDPEVRAEALIGAARSLFAQQKYREAAETALNAQKLSPRHPLALVVALDCLRSSGAGEPYRSAVLTFLAQDPKNPVLFEAYAGYLKLRGIVADDQTLMQDYGKQKPSDSLAEVTQLVNLGHFNHLDHKPQACLSYYQQARKRAEQMTAPPPDLIPIIDALLVQAKAAQ